MIYEYNEGDYRDDYALWPIWMHTMSSLHMRQCANDPHFHSTLDRAFELEQTIARERWDCRD